MCEGMNDGWMNVWTNGLKEGMMDGWIDWMMVTLINLYGWECEKFSLSLSCSLLLSVYLCLSVSLFE